MTGLELGRDSLTNLKPNLTALQITTALLRLDIHLFIYWTCTKCQNGPRLWEHKYLLAGMLHYNGEERQLACDYIITKCCGY